MGKKRSSSEVVRKLGLGVMVLALMGPAAVGFARSAAQTAPAVSLIYAGWFGNTIPTPAFIKNNRAFLDSQPFRGMVAYLRDDATGTNATTGIMGHSAMTLSTLTGLLSPLQGLPFTNLVDNFGLVQGTTPPDFFDDWSMTIQNFANLATALRSAGLRGICFDNEQYAAPWGTYPAGAKYPTRSLLDYQSQARLRGSQVMQAMVAQFPSIAVLTLHGPYISELKAPASLEFPQWQSGNLLLGPFFAGFLDGAGTTASSVDGGELYTLRSESQFINSYNWRKFTLPSAAIDCPFIPQALRTVWPDRVSISFGVYDQPFSGAPMDASVLKTTLTNALLHADRYVWFYTEGPSFLLPPASGGASAAWVDSVRQAVASVPAPTPPPAPSTLAAVPLSTTSVELSWTNTASAGTGVEIERKTGSTGSWSSLTQLGSVATQYQDAGVLPATTYVYRVRTTSGALSSAFSNEATATTAAAAGGSGSPAPDPAGAPTAGGGGSGGSCGLLGLEGFVLFLPLMAVLRWRKIADPEDDEQD